MMRYVISEDGELIHCEIEFEASKYEEDFYNSEEDSSDNMDVAYAFQDLLEEEEDSNSEESEESLKDKIIVTGKHGTSSRHIYIWIIGTMLSCKNEKKIVFFLVGQIYD